MSELTELMVNGQPCQTTAPADTALLYVLRDDFGMKGTRFGCGAGYCGACMVLIDGRPEPSCRVSLGAVAGREVTTVEGLADGTQLSPLQEAFVDEGAGQCGFCLSGILMSATALLRRELSPGETELLAALDAHICRCGSQPRIIRAIQRVSASRRR